MSLLRSSGSAAETRSVRHPGREVVATRGRGRRTRSASPPRSADAGPSRGVRPEIQALRAVAVGMVVVYHAVPRLMPGGYIGVDVFFVISGFLITSHLARELETTGRLSFTRFYVRRARRLLPAALTVLGVVGLFTLLRLPSTMWGGIGEQLLSSTFYVQNWTLAGQSVDYLAAGSRPGPLQHFWSLSVEEQFYIVWPALLALAVVLGRHWAGRRRALCLAIAAVTALSFGYSLLATAQSPAWAYFVTTTRAWELGAGGLLAVTLPKLPGPRSLRITLSWLGLGVIAVCALRMNGATAFPGYAAALPVLGAVAVIAAGSEPGRLSSSRILDWRFLQWIGDLSYSIYLWHWPLLILVPVLLKGPGYHPPTVVMPLIAAAAIPVAAVSKRWIEDPLRTSGQQSSRSRRHRFVFPGVVATLLVTTTVVGGALFALDHAQVERAQRELLAFDVSHQPCAGAGSLLPQCRGRAPSGVHPAPVIATRDAVQQNCQQRGDRAGLLPCHYGASGPGALEVVVVGDSHANQWMPALTRVAEAEGWHLVTYFKSGCPYAVGLGPGSCVSFDQRVAKRLEAERPDLLITSARSGEGYGSHASQATATRAFAQAWRPVIEAGGHVAVLADVPQPGLGGVLDPPSCVAEGDSCEVRADDVVGDQALATAARASGADLVDLRPQFCPRGRCPAVMGGVLVYRDSNHMTATFASTLTPYLRTALTSVSAR
jgi:peptidoglycan/LPS O-acetylase OafA/YrhL